MSDGKRQIKDGRNNLFLGTLLIIAIGFSILTALTVKNRIDEQYNQLEETTLEIANSYSHSLTHASEAYEIITELLDEKIRITSQAIMLIENKDNNEVLDSISQTFNVDEIHLYNNEGVITNSTYEEFIGWQAPEGHPVHDFMMSDQTMLVEDVRPDTETGLYYKFGYVKDETGGFVQLGILAENIQDFIGAFEITKLLSDISNREM